MNTSKCVFYLLHSVFVYRTGFLERSSLDQAMRTKFRYHQSAIEQMSEVEVSRENFDLLNF